MPNHIPEQRKLKFSSLNRQMGIDLGRSFAGTPQTACKANPDHTRKRPRYQFCGGDGLGGWGRTVCLLFAFVYLHGSCKVSQSALLWI